MSDYNGPDNFAAEAMQSAAPANYQQNSGGYPPANNYQSEQRQPYQPPANNYQQNNGGGGYQQRPNYQQNNGGGGYQQNGGGGYQQRPKYQNGGGGGYQAKKPFTNYNKPQEPEGEAVPYKAYVGTGNKDAPPHVLEEMKKIALELEGFGYTLRTGGMGEGPDDAFEFSGVKDLELYIPWQGFNDKQSKNYFNDQRSKDIAKLFNQAFDTLKPAIQAFLAKNVRMVLGKELRSRPMFILIWSDEGAETVAEAVNRTSNMNTIIKIAATYKIPLFNMARPDAISRLKKYLEIG